MYVWLREWPRWSCDVFPNVRYLTGRMNLSRICFVFAKRRLGDTFLAENLTYYNPRPAKTVTLGIKTDRVLGFSSCHEDMT